MPDSTLDRWVQRGALAAMVAVGVVLLAVGLALY
jgi:hypothetical protein